MPGHITSRASTGANRLIQDGAKLVLTVDDVLSELNLRMVPQQLELRQLLPENETEALLLSRLDAAGEPATLTSSAARRDCRLPPSPARSS